VPERGVHPQAFDFDVLYTKSITQALDAVRVWTTPRTACW
jgi:hypothetical protein